MEILKDVLLKEFKSEFFAVLKKGFGSKDDQTGFGMEIDLLTIMDQQRCVDKRIGQLVHDRFKIIGEEVHEEPDDLVYHWVMDVDGQVKILSLQIVDYDYYHQEKVMDINEYDVVYLKDNEDIRRVEGESIIQEPSAMLSDEHVNSLWFRFFKTANKLCKKDNLFGLHLLLELIKEYAVLDMMKRGVKIQPGIHPQEGFDQLPPEISIDQVHTTDTVKLLEYLDRLAGKVDDGLLEMSGDYDSRYDVFRDYIGICMREIGC